MNKKIITLAVLTMFATLVCGCQGKQTVETNVTESVEQKNDIKEPDLSQVRSICKLATLECYYHNVAKSNKEAGTGLSHWGEKNRKFWVEYTGVVKIGVDMSKGSMDVDGTNITIYMPDAEILSIKPDSNSTSDTITESDSWNSNPIEAKDVTKAVNDAEESIRENIENDSSLLANAQDRAKKLIENYINQLGEISGTQFKIIWKTVDNSVN